MLKTLEFDLWKQLEEDKALSNEQKMIRDIPCLKLVGLEYVRGSHDYMLGTLTDGRVLSFVVKGPSMEAFQMHHVGTVESQMVRFQRE